MTNRITMGLGALGLHAPAWGALGLTIAAPSAALAQTATEAPAPAPAAPVATALPAPMRAMLDDAIASGNATDIDTVSRYLKRAVPQATGEIDAAVSEWNTRQAQAEAAKLAERKAHDAGWLRGWKGEGQAGAFMTSGNSDNSGVSLGLSLTKESEHWRHNFRALTDYQRTNGVTSRSEWLVSYEPNWKFNDYLFAFGLGQFERDRFQGYNSRIALSGGIGYRVIRSANITLDLKTGPAWRKSDYVASPDDERFNWLAASRFSWRFSPSLTFTDSFDALIDQRSNSLSNLAALDAKLGGSLSARLSYQVKYESNPPGKIKHTDTLSRMTIVYGF